VIVHIFEALVAAHIVTGSIGLVCVWVPIVGRKGGDTHRLWGRVFAKSMLATGSIAIGVSLCTLAAPLETHPFWTDAAQVRGVFGYMMLYLATMTIMLARYGLLCIKHKRNHLAHRTPANFFWQAATFVVAVNCTIQGVLLSNPLMVGISVVGIAAAILNTRFMLTEQPPFNEWIVQHTRGLVGAGISVYTAFLAFGAVNLLPAYAFNPFLWATPTVLGVSLLLYHQYRVMVQRRRFTAARQVPRAG